MILRKWEDLPDFMRVEEVRPYWEVLAKKKNQLLIKRIVDFMLAGVLLILLAIPMLVIAILIKIDSPGNIFFRQERVTMYGRRFRIHKFRTMVNDAEKMGAGVTVSNDCRITRVGAKLRTTRLDELPQLLDVICGNMSFVGTRPETAKYVMKYMPEYNATLLMRAGITSEASIRYKDEARLLDEAEDVDRVYVEKILPAKMSWNLHSLKSFKLFGDIRTMLRTVLAVMGKEYK